MTTYAIGDIQGCYQPLLQLLDKINFDASQDVLWFSGDLVNRGPDSLAVLRLVKGLGSQAVTVLGNHDLHLLAVAAGLEHQRRKDTLSDILNAPDRDELLTWLRQQPLLHHDTTLNFTLVHAGIPAAWDLPQALALATEVTAVLRGNDYQNFLAHMYGNEPAYWQAELRDWDRLRFITNAFTRMRYCDQQGGLDLAVKGSLGSQPAGYVPWYRVPNRKMAHKPILFGHWSALQDEHYPDIYPLDTGCLWGGALTALRLSPVPEAIRITCSEILSPS